MPNIKSAKKRVKVIATKTLRNKAINTALKTDIKKANIALENKDANTAEAVKVAIRAIDKATKKVFFIRILLPEKNLRLHKSLTLLTHNCYA